MKEDTKEIKLQPDDGTYCEPSVHDLKVSEGEICPKGFGAIATMSVESSCCEPNNGRFEINGEDMDGMPGVSFPGEGGGNDHGEGLERKAVKIDCDNFKYDIKDGDWNIKWMGLCDQKPGFFSYETTFKQKTDCSSGGGGGGEPTPPAPPQPDFNVDPIPPGANDGRGNCGLDDGCKPTGTVWGAGDFKDWMELVGSDGHKVTYTRQNQMEETPIGDSIPGLHPGIVYDYTLFSDCGVSNDGLVNGACQIDHKISMEGRKMEMEDMMGEPNSINYTDLVLTLDEGVGVFAKTGAATGTLTMADTCAGEEEVEEEDENANITCKTGTILTTGYTDPTFYTHAFDPAMVRSVDVINPHDPDKRFMRIVFDPHVCDVDEIIETLCMCTSEDAFGDPIVEFGEVTATKVDDYTIDVVIRGWIIETNGYEP